MRLGATRWRGAAAQGKPGAPESHEKMGRHGLARTRRHTQVAADAGVILVGKQCKKLPPVAAAALRRPAATPGRQMVATEEWAQACVNAQLLLPVDAFEAPLRARAVAEAEAAATAAAAAVAPAAAAAGDGGGSAGGGGGGGGRGGARGRQEAGAERGRPQKRRWGGARRVRARGAGRGGLHPGASGTDIMQCRGQADAAPECPTTTPPHLRAPAGGPRCSVPRS
jgi:hypothetical protein